MSNSYKSLTLQALAQCGTNPKISIRNTFYQKNMFVVRFQYEGNCRIFLSIPRGLPQQFFAKINLSLSICCYSQFKYIFFLLYFTPAYTRHSSSEVTPEHNKNPNHIPTFLDNVLMNPIIKN